MALKKINGLGLEPLPFIPCQIFPVCLLCVALLFLGVWLAAACWELPGIRALASSCTTLPPAQLDTALDTRQGWGVLGLWQAGGIAEVATAGECGIRVHDGALYKPSANGTSPSSSLLLTLPGSA